MWMNRDVITIAPETSLSEAAFLMAHRRVRRLAVVHATPTGPHLVGILARSDVFAAFPSEINPFSVNATDRFHSATAVGEVMSRALVTTTPDTPIEVAARAMNDHKIGALPVVLDAHLVGFITESDIFRAFVELMGSTPGEARVTFNALPHEDALALVLRLGQANNVRLVSVLSASHAGHPMCVVRVSGAGIDQFVDALWKSHHPPLSVVRS